MGVICRNNELKDNHDDNTEEGEPAEHEGVSVSTAKTLTSAFSEYWGVEFLNVVLGDDGKYRLIMRDNETVELMLSVQNSSFRINFK